MSVVLRPDGRRSRFILLDGAPYMCRAVSYSPVPIGEDPSYHEPFGDYFTDNYGGIWRRDLALFKEMGANTVRLYAWRLKSRHNQFLDEADRHGLTVMSVFEMGTAEDTPVGTPAERQSSTRASQTGFDLATPRDHGVVHRQRAQRRVNAHVCEKDYEEKFLHFPGGCTFKDNATRLCELIDDACAVVQAEGKLCTMPWAAWDARQVQLADWAAVWLGPGLGVAELDEGVRGDCAGRAAGARGRSSTAARSTRAEHIDF